MYRCSDSPHGDFFVQSVWNVRRNVALSVWRGATRPLRSCLVTRVVTGIIYVVKIFSFWPFFTHTEHKMPVEICQCLAENVASPVTTRISLAIIRNYETTVPFIGESSGESKRSKLKGPTQPVVLINAQYKQTVINWILFYTALQ